MKKIEIFLTIVVILITIGTVLGVYSYEKYRRSQLYDVELTARAPENGNWYPEKITVSYGETIKIYIRNIDTVSHGFALPDFEVAVNEIKAGTIEIIEFTADKKGTFPFMCTIWCSERHLEMNGEIIVE